MDQTPARREGRDKSTKLFGALLERALELAFCGGNMFVHSQTARPIEPLTAKPLAGDRVEVREVSGAVLLSGHGRVKRAPPRAGCGGRFPAAYLFEYPRNAVGLPWSRPKRCTLKTTTPQNSRRAVELQATATSSCMFLTGAAQNYFVLKLAADVRVPACQRPRSRDRG